MKIMDQKYGAEMITSKGKVYKFDSAECLANFVKHEEAGKDAKLMLVTDVAPPHSLIDAQSAMYLHSLQLPSPMGAFISAFSHADSLKKWRTTYPGDQWTWDEVKKNLH
jgi:copper chaperone NosL